MVSSSIPSMPSISESMSSSSESDSSKSMSSRLSGYSWTKGEDGVCIDADEGVLTSDDMDGCDVKIVTLGLMDATWCGARKRLEI